MSKQKNELCYISLQENIIRASRQNKELFDELSKNFKKIYVLRLGNLKLFEKKFKINLKEAELLPGNFEIIELNDVKSFLNFSKDKKLIIIADELNKSPSDFKIFLLLKLANASLIFINNVGGFGGKIFIDTELKKFFKSFTHFYKKGFYYIWRLFTILNFFPKVEILFECNKDIIKAFRSGLSQKVENKLKIPISLYRNIIPINSTSVDFKLKNPDNENLKEDYLLYIDSPINHLHRTDREGEVSQDDLDEFYSNLYILLEKLGKLFQKKVYCTMHPSYFKDQNKYKESVFNKSNNLILSSSRSVDLVKNSKIVLFTHSTAVLNAIVFKKKIICLKSKHLGIAFSRLNQKYSNEFNLFSLNIDNYSNLDAKIIEDKIKPDIDKYDNYIKNNLSDGTNELSSKKISRTIKKYYNFN